MSPGREDTAGTWSGLIALLDVETVDGRVVRDATWRDLPLPLMWWGTGSDPGGSRLIGHVLRIWRTENRIYASGQVDLVPIVHLTGVDLVPTPQVRGGLWLPVGVDMDQAEIDEDASYRFDDDGSPGPVVISTGRIRALTAYAKDSAAWPECRIKVELS